MASVYQRIIAHPRFRPPTNWLQIQTIDMHTGGEPLRLIVSGFPELGGRTVLECRRELKARFDHLRKVLMHEPRGHADMYGCLLLPPNDDEADFGILFLHNEGYSTMCGHAIIAVTTLAVEMGWVEKTAPLSKLTIDAPCGRIESFARMADGEVQSVFFHGVPSFVLALDQQIELPDFGTIQYDLAYGGAFYAYVHADQFQLHLRPTQYSQLIRLGMEIKRAIVQDGPAIEHPFEADLSFLYGTIFIGGPVSEGINSRNVCVFAEGEVDRCPTGSGVSGRMAIHCARKELGIGEQMAIESIVGSVFKGSIVKKTTFGPFDAVIPQVEGTAHITGQHSFLLDPNDPFQEGFFLR